MYYELFLAKRFAFSRRRENFITKITAISVLGITVGSAALIIVMSVFNGFSSVVTNLLVSFDPHLRVIPASSTGSSSFENAPDVLKKVRAALPGARTAPSVRGKAVLVHFTLPRVVQLTGLDSAGAKAVTGLADRMQAGALSLDGNSLVIGQLLADDLALIIGDTVQIYSPAGLERILTEPVAPRTRTLIVRGIFGTNNREYDAMNAYTGIDAASDLFEIPGSGASSVDVKLADIQESAHAKEVLQATLGPGVQVQTWFDLHTDLYSVMEIERWIAYTILFLIVAVASFSIFSSLTLTVFEKQRDIGLLRALGASERGIRLVYLYQGGITGILGTLLGLTIGIAVVLLQKQFGFVTLDTSVYIIPAMPVELRLADILIVGGGSMLLATGAALRPARRAALIEPAQALRWE